MNKPATNHALKPAVATKAKAVKTPTSKKGSEDNAEVKMFTALLEDADKELVVNAKRKSKDTSFGIVFEGPSKSEILKASREPATPLQDGAGRPRYVVTRLCWCAADAAVENDCRFHSVSEAGWSVCPAKPAYYDKKDFEGKHPKKLWTVNGDFGKPKDKTVTSTEEAIVVA